MDDLEKLSREIFEAQPFTRLVGAQLVEVGAGKAVVELAITDQLKQQHGFVHGGVMSYLADNAMTFAGGLSLASDAVTSEYKINYLKPAVSGTIVARARAEGTGKRQAVCRCQIVVLEGGQETLCALAQGTVVSLGPVKTNVLKVSHGSNESRKPVNSGSVTLGLPVENLELATSWYRRLLNNPEEVVPAPGVHELCLYGSTWLQLFEREELGSSEAVLRLETSDIEQCHDRIREMGVEPGKIEHVPGAVRYFDFRDPSGNLVSFYEMATAEMGLEA